MLQLNGIKHESSRLFESEKVNGDSQALCDSELRNQCQKVGECSVNKGWDLNKEKESINEQEEQVNILKKSQRIKSETLLLIKQIEQLETNDQYETKLRYQSEAFVLNKRRNNLFRSYQKWEESQEKFSKQEGAIIMDQQMNRKKMTTKNSLKIQKLLNTFLFKNDLEQQKTAQYLEFISGKHKISLEVLGNANSIKKPVITNNNQIGYKQSDLRKVKKYQLDINRLPALGIIYDIEDKRNEIDNGQDETKVEQKGIVGEIYRQGIDCFDSKIQQKGYLNPQGGLKLQFAQNRRQIFKLSRQMNRHRQEKEGICKKLAYLCMKEVERKYLKSVKVQNQNIIRAKKLHRECLIYWRKREKELTEVKKKKERLQAELKKREEEEQEAKKQEKRLQYIMYQSGLYSHFMATKLGMDGQQKKDIEKVAIPGGENLDIDQQAAQLTVNQIINSKQENLQKFAKPDDILDLSTIDQAKIAQAVGAPSSFIGSLKQYQIKGLRWLNNLFQQGINGILADQMGLGKTIQAIALLAHVSQNKNIWGPFLIVAPNSTLFNWQQQFKKFCPALKILPYWGNIKQRKTLRKFFSPKKFTQKADSPFHVVITSYQLTVTDDKVFKKMKWQFMILDQAQAIKNVLSQRWNTLKEFQSRNRLLLTGTPIQNNMAELWALLNFVMPDLFDSHELFNQWFSKDIQAHSQDAKQLDQIKIQRLHAILKPFMLRRIKKDVEHQIGKKIEHQILCQMTKRQKLLYESIKEKLNVKDLFKMFESKAKVQNLMNLVMQLRKVCNHPQLFERRPALSPFLFQDMYYYTGYIPIKAGNIKLLSFSSKNPIFFSYPKIAYDQLVKYRQPRELLIRRFCNIYSVSNQVNNSAFAILDLMGLSKGQVQICFKEDLLFTNLLLLHWLKTNQYTKKLSTLQNLLFYQQKAKSFQIEKFKLFYRDINHSYIPSATAPSVQINISSRQYYDTLDLKKHNKFYNFILYGQHKEKFEFYMKGNSRNEIKQQFKGFLYNSPSLAKIEVINFGNLIADSSKLRQLDKILKEKKKNSDKVLIFCQMTKMIDILQDFMNLRKYSFFRLDGACNIADRRDMVNQFQKTTSKTFVFLLSTRAGGLGVTLTAANTVIFYDNDWNPTMDAQATDRAHRIGQSRDVNVYQLVTKGTIEQRIVKRAQQKKTVQSTVYEGASFNFFKKDMILELMVDEFDEKGNPSEQKGKKDGKEKKKGKKGRDEGRERNPENKENEMMRRMEQKQRSNEQRDDGNELDQ